MNTEQREEIEDACLELEADFKQDVLCSMSWPEISTLIQFARQQLNLRVDGEKLREKIIENVDWSHDLFDLDSVELEALVLECLTTTPEEKE